MSKDIQTKKLKGDISFNKSIQSCSDKSIFESIKSAFRSSTPFKDDASSVEFISEPFPCCVIPNFINDGDFPTKLKKELLSLTFHDKSNDLYKFKQSDDLQNSKLPAVSVFRSIVFSEFRSWLNDVTEKNLNETVDMSCAKYEYTDTLLCHDDELEDRVIAFIYYLVPPWSKEDGGTLDLYSVDQHGQPDKIIRSLVPSFNSLVFFEVTPVSFHQVAEVLSKDKCRLSISGWFHGPAKERPAPYLEPKLVFKSALDIEDEVLMEWVNPIYLNIEIVSSIQEQFEEENEILLKDFLLNPLPPDNFRKGHAKLFIHLHPPFTHLHFDLIQSHHQNLKVIKEDKYKAIESELISLDHEWSRLGPPNKRCYDTADEISSTSTLHDVVTFLSSRPLFKLLTKLTGLDLANIPEQNDDDDDGDEPSADVGPSTTKNSRSRTEVRRWRHGYYTLLHDDDDSQGADYALNSLLYVKCDDWDLEAGGFTSYVSKEDDEELLTVEPCSNCFALTYSDPDTLHFVKHINSRCLSMSKESEADDGICFYDIATTYLE